VDDVLVRVEGVSKKFCRRLRHSVYYGTVDVARGMLGLDPNMESLREGEFWAVQDVSFELKRGETLGLIGPNGSGKSTLLRMINGIFQPDKGRIEIKGKVGALIAVGAGFHPLMTGRENIYLNGAILGMGRREVDRKFDAIVDFADIGEFLDAPVKTYSSGMYVRLGFAVAIHCEPDILLVDEVLAVGDVKFQNKCLNMIHKLKTVQGCSIILVSHNYNTVKIISHRCIYLEHGRIALEGEPTVVIRDAQERIFTQGGGSRTDGRYVSELVEMGLLDSCFKPITHVQSGDKAYLDMVFTERVEFSERLLVAMSFINIENGYNSRVNFDGLEVSPGTRTRIRIAFSNFALPEGVYTVRMSLSDGSFINRIYHFEDTIYFVVRGGDMAAYLKPSWEVVG